MSEKIILDREQQINKKLFKYSQELVLLNYAYESNFLSKEEMLAIKREIMKSYGILDFSLY